MYNVSELIERMERANSWKEVGITLSEMISMLKSLCDDIGAITPSDDAEKRRMKSKIDRLTESNKKLIEENKKLKGMK